MGKIARITTQKKNKSRYNIFIQDGKSDSYAFSVDEDLLVKYMLRKDLDLDDATIEMLKSQDEIHKFYSMCLNLLSFRIRSEKEIKDYLRKKEAEDEQIDKVVRQLKEEGYIDDQEFANVFVRSRMNTSSKGPLLLKKELFEKGVDPAKTEEGLKWYTTELQQRKLEKLVEKKLRSGSKKSLQQQLQTLQATLIQKGFSSDLVQMALLEAKESWKDEEAEQQAVTYQGLKILSKYEKKSQGYELKQKVKAALYRKGFHIDQIEAFMDEHVKENVD
ncbi:regulatory protein [Salirhabdus euzebyi]|uniref:Regulatory protein RecX n=1 Tax=Salirhabdus euzebyi TaxID=394506 RepID=A0A841Q9L5_9BACI|nr:recombination regulator RecX [Salirhabdus euzebyi]MBB6455086.1 regulatory protein [Salirhabdus euzebyi]